MNLKIFSVIIGILTTVIAILSGLYYYLFEYSKPKSYTVTNTSTQINRQNSYSSNRYDTTVTNSYINSSIVQNDDFNTTNIQEINFPDLNQSLEKEYNLTNTLNENNQSLIKNEKISKKEANQTKSETLNKQQKIAEEKTPKKAPQTKNSNKHTSNNKKPTAAQEYLTLGKNSRLEPELSTENMKIYILGGKFLSQYRINLLKEMLSTIENSSKDYSLSIFVKTLPKGEMELTIYNKDIIFSDKKKAYRYINIDKITPYLNTLEKLNQHVAREEILEKLKLQIKKEGKGSEFSKHIRSLKTGLNTAQYFFPFCEIIEITSIK